MQSMSSWQSLVHCAVSLEQLSQCADCREAAEAAQTAALETKASLTREKKASHALQHDARWACNTTAKGMRDTGSHDTRPAFPLQQPHATIHAWLGP